MFSPSTCSRIVCAFGAQTRKCTPPSGCTSAPIGMARFGTVDGAEAAAIYAGPGAEVAGMSRRAQARRHLNQWLRRGLVPSRDGSLIFRQRGIVRRAIAAGGRRLDDDRLACFQDGSIAGPQRLDPALGPPHGIFAGLAGFAARKPERAHAAMPRQDRALHLLQKTDG